MACSEVAAALQTAGAHCTLNIFLPMSKQFCVCCQGLREKFFQRVQRSMPGPQNSSGPKVARNFLFCFSAKNSEFSPIICPKLGEDQKKRSSLKFSPIFCPKLGEDQKNLTRKPEVFRPPPPRLGPGYLLLQPTS